MTAPRAPGEPASPAAPPPRGLACTDCGCRNWFVRATRRREGWILRIRDCRNCGRRVVTREKICGDGQIG